MSSDLRRPSPCGRLSANTATRASRCLPHFTNTSAENSSREGASAGFLTDEILAHTCEHFQFGIGLPVFGEHLARVSSGEQP